MSDNTNAVQDNSSLEGVFLLNDDELNFDEIENKLDAELEAKFFDLDLLEDEQEKIGNPDSIGDTVLTVVWEQFINQVGAVAGQDFIEENRGLKLDLRDKAHILTAEEFNKGNLPTHNFENKEKYERRYNETRADYQTDPNMDIKMSNNMRYNEDTKTYERYDSKKNDWVGKTRYNEETKTWEDYEPRTGKWEKKLASDARKNFDTRTNNEKGSKTVNKDHVISAAEQIRDTEAAAYMDRKDRQDFAKSDVNIQDLDSSANQSKSDLSTEEWLNLPREDGQSQAEYFGVDEEEMRRRDKEAREAYQKEKEEAKQKAVEEGRKSQKEEAFRIGGKALRAVLMGLLTELIKNIVQKLISWIRAGEKNFKSFIEQIKDALLTFVTNFKQNVLTAGNTLITTIATAIVGPVVATIKKAWMLIKQGGKTIKDAINYLRDPANKEKPLNMKMLRVGEIAIGGLTATAAIVSGELFEKALMSIPVFAIEIPLLGSLANIMGIFLGAVVSGIIGALILRLIDKAIAKKQKEENLNSQIEKKNEILDLQGKLTTVKLDKLEDTKEHSAASITNRHSEAGEIISEALSTIFREDEDDNECRFASIDESLDSLLKEDY